MANSFEPEYIKARSALLDALEGLGSHHASIILIGAQAIYVHTGETEFTVAPFTYDADLALDPRDLAGSPKIIEAMLMAGFNQTDQPGIYRNSDGSQVDLLVPAALGGRPGRRGAALGEQGNLAARQVSGIEGVLVDHRVMTIRALDPTDKRSVAVKVAGPAALLVAKVHKVSERMDEPVLRQDDKDAFDIYRLLRAVETEDLAAGLERLIEQEISSPVTQHALALFEAHFGSEDGAGTRMVVRHVEGLEDPNFIAASCVTLTQDLLSEL